MDLFRSLSFILFLSVINYQGIIAGTVSTAPSLTATIGGSVDFTCTYTVDSGDNVYPGAISWQTKKQGSEEFQNIASFSPPGSGGSNSFTNYPVAEDYRNRSELFNVTANGANSYVVVMRINGVVCSDEKHYRCSVLFINPASGTVSGTKETSLTTRTPAEQPYEIPAPVPDNIEENMEVTLSCTANVGKPRGQIRWWRYRQGITAPQEMTGVSTSTPPVQEGVCVYNVTSTVTYRMTKDDDQSVWRCFVNNSLLTMPDRDKPNQESKRVNVFFKVNVPTIKKEPDTGADSQYSVGASVTLTCQAEGNPTPGIHTNKTVNRYQWTFKADPNDNTTELSSVNGTLTLTNLQETDTGTYTCTAFNGFNGKFFNASTDQILQIVKTTTTTTPTTTPLASPTGSTGRPTAAPQGEEDGGLGAGPIAGIIIGVIILIIIIFLAVWCICKRRQLKEDSIDEPPEKPIRNNQDLTFVNRPDIVNNDKNSPFYGQEKKQYNNDLQYADLTFDDKPRSRKPIQLYDTNGLNNGPYSDAVMMPSV